MIEKKGFVICESTNTVTPALIASTPEVVTFEAELQEAEAPNRNGRIYSKEAIVGALNHYSVQEKLQHKSFFGESNHPLSSDPKRQMYINQRNISHIVTATRWEGNRLIGTIETANTEAGRDMCGLIRQGSNVAFSMRGMSNNISRDGEYQRVGGPLMIVAYDYVIVPSHPNSYMTKRITESAEMKSLLESGATADRPGEISTVNMIELLEFTKNKSDNVQALCESLGFESSLQEGAISLDNTNGILSVSKDNETLKCFIEENIKINIDDIFKKMTTFK